MTDNPPLLVTFTDTDGSTHQFQHTPGPRPPTPERERPRPKVVTEELMLPFGETLRTQYQEWP